MTAKEATAWVVTRLSAPAEALEIKTVEINDPVANQVRINVEAFCLDFNDIDTIRGRYGLLKFEPPFVVGMAAAGTVEAVGAGCEALLGRRVVGVASGAQGAYASVALLDGSSVQLLPRWLSAVEGIAMYFPYLLSYLALRVRGRIGPGNVVLVHAAAGGAGSAAVQLAKAFGATVIATAGTDEKIEFCRSLGADYGVNYRSEDFVAFIDDVTNGRGVDLAFDTVGGAVTTETFRVMAFNGRHLIIGFASGIEEEERPMSIQPSIYGNFDLVGICFAFVDSPRATRTFGMNFLTTAQGVDIWNQILHLARAGTIRPVIGREIEFTEVPGALGALERRDTIGRTVVRTPAHPAPATIARRGNPETKAGRD